MAFKITGWSAFTKNGDIRKINRAKRKVRKSVDDIAIDSPTYDPNLSNKKFKKAERKQIKADKLLQKAGYGLGEREEATGAGGYDAAMDWATEPAVRKKKKSPLNQKTKKEIAGEILGQEITEDGKGNYKIGVDYKVAGVGKVITDPKGILKKHTKDGYIQDLDFTYKTKGDTTRVTGIRIPKKGE